MKDGQFALVPEKHRLWTGEIRRGIGPATSTNTPHYRELVRSRNARLTEEQKDCWN